MVKTITLTESDIRDMVLESISELYMQQGENEVSLKNLALYGGLAAATIGGVNHIQKTENPSNIQHTVFAYNNDNLSNDTVNYADYMQQNYTNRFKPKEEQKQKQPQIYQYKPTQELISYIKSYETFHEGWKDDGAGNPTTGWGFKITPELKKRYPTGMHVHKDGTTPEADAYLIEYIAKQTPRFQSLTPNIEKLPQHVADALFDLYYNIGETNYKNSPNLQKALAECDIDGIIENLRYAGNGKLKGLAYRSADRQEMAANGDYNRDYNQYF